MFYSPCLANQSAPISSLHLLQFSHQLPHVTLVCCYFCSCSLFSIIIYSFSKFFSAGMLNNHMNPFSCVPITFIPRQLFKFPSFGVNDKIKMEDFICLVQAFLTNSFLTSKIIRSHDLFVQSKPCSWLTLGLSNVHQIRWPNGFSTCLPALDSIWILHCMSTIDTTNLFLNNN